MYNDQEDKGESLESVITKSSTAEEQVELTVAAAPLSPLGWTIGARLLSAVAAAAFLWLAVAWAIGWL